MAHAGHADFPDRPVSSFPVLTGAAFIETLKLAAREGPKAVPTGKLLRAALEVEKYLEARENAHASATA